jgi:hypothetical protein
LLIGLVEWIASSNTHASTSPLVRVIQPERVIVAFGRSKKKNDSKQQEQLEANPLGLTVARGAPNPLRIVTVMAQQTNGSNRTDRGAPHFRTRARSLQVL